MKRPSGLFARPWALALAGVILLAAHGLAFYFLRHLALSATVVSGVIILVVIKHLGLLGSSIGLLRRRFRG
jgi:hypothetical protein